MNDQRPYVVDTPSRSGFKVRTACYAAERPHAVRVLDPDREYACVVANSGEFDKQSGHWFGSGASLLPGVIGGLVGRSLIVGRTQRQLPVEIHMS